MDATTPLYVDVSATGAADAAAGLAALTRLDVPLAVIGAGRPMGDDWPAARRRWDGRLVLRGEALVPPGEPRWNLAARDEGLRGRAVAAAADALRAAADLGAPLYVVHAGWCLELTRDDRGRPVGPTSTPARARDQLCRSLDRLATLADGLGLGLLVETDADLPAERPVLGDPEATLAVLERVAAPPLGLLAELPAIVATGRRHGEEPEVIGDLLARWVRAIGLHRGDGKGGAHDVLREADVEWGLAKRLGGLAKPVLLSLREVEPARLAEQITMARELLAAPASVEVKGPIRP